MRAILYHANMMLAKTFRRVSNVIWYAFDHANNEWMQEILEYVDYKISSFASDFLKRCDRFSDTPKVWR